MDIIIECQFNLKSDTGQPFQFCGNFVLTEFNKYYSEANSKYCWVCKDVPNRIIPLCSDWVLFVGGSHNFIFCKDKRWCRTGRSDVNDCYVLLVEFKEEDLNRLGHTLQCYCSKDQDLIWCVDNSYENSPINSA